MGGKVKVRTGVICPKCWKEVPFLVPLRETGSTVELERSNLVCFACLRRLMRLQESANMGALLSDSSGI